MAPTARIAAAVAAPAALVVAWLVPPLAVLAVWPLLLFVPGWLLVAALAPRVDLPGRIGVAVVVSVAVSAHLVFWLSHLLGGYGRPAVFAAAALLSLAVPLAVGRGLPLGRVPSLRASLRALVLATLSLAFVGITLAVSVWRIGPEYVSSGGWNWSDFGVHLAITETLNSGGNFPPEYPTFAGVPLTYHWFADFHAAILAKAADLFSPAAMVVQSAVLTGALALLVFSLARRLARVAEARRVALLAAALVIFGGGLGWVKFVGDLDAGQGSPFELIARISYDNWWFGEWPYFRIPSVMGTGLLAHRATTAGLPMFVAGILLLIAGLPTARQKAAGWRDRPAAIALSGILGALLAPFHFFFFPVYPLLALAWVLLSGRLFDRLAPRHAVLFLAPYALSIPFALAPLLQASGSGALRLVQIWPTAPRDDGLAAVAFFYVTNLGVPFVLALAALWWREAPRRAFLGVWLVGLFLIPNLIVFSVIDFDMNKYFQVMWVAVAVLAAWLMRRWSVPAVVAVLALSVPSPLLVAGWHAVSDIPVISSAEYAASRWIAASTDPRAVFVTDGFVNALTDSAGRRRLTTYGPQVENLGYSTFQRIADVTAIYCGGDVARSVELMRRYGATYLVDSGRPNPCAAPVDFATTPALRLVYEPGPRIWQLADPSTGAAGSEPAN